MDKKGQAQVGLIVMIAIVCIVGVILFQAIAQESGKSTTLVTLSNQTISTPANGTAYYFTSYKYFDETTLVVTNASSGTVINSGNYTITNNNIYNGALSVMLVPNADPAFAGKPWNISVTAQPLEYISEGGARSIVPLIAIFFALAIGIVALTPTLRSGVLDMIGK
jgi:protein-S-isoprenylcysteine O-methyltransferase Ste14